MDSKGFELVQVSSGTARKTPPSASAPKLQDEYTGKKTSFAAYRAVIATARRQLDWLLEQLNRPPA